MMRIGIFEEKDKWTGAIALSAGLHVLLAVAITVVGILRGLSGQRWGGPVSGDNAMHVGIVNSVPLPLPAPQHPTENIVATDNKGLTQSVPAKPQEDTTAIPIPEKVTKDKTKKTAVTPAPPTPRPVTPAPDNKIDYGGGGQPTFTAGNIQGGLNFEGDFGTRFAWYVTAMENTVSRNWYATEIGPGAQGHKAFVSFDIARDGAPTNVKLEQSSGIPTLDQSAVRAIQRIDGFGRLPPEYSGSYLHVELWFNPPR
jgi:periplasmic protein TonB